MKPEFFKKYDFQRFFEELKKKYKIYGKLTGQIKIENLNQTEVLAFEELGKYYKIGDTIIYKIKKLDKFLEDSIYSEDAKQILFNYYKTEFEINSDKRKRLDNNKNEFFNKILTNFENTIAYSYLKAICMENKSIYKTISLRYNEDKDKLKEELIFLGKSLNNLPYFENTFQNMAIFSQSITGDPHYFDETNRFFTLLYEGIKFIKNITQISDNIIEKNQILYNAGLIKDGLLNTITIYGFTGINQENKESLLLKASLQEKEYLTLSLNNLNSLMSLEAVSNKIYVFENPSVFSYIFEYFKNSNLQIPTMICTTGQLNFSAYQFFNKLLKENFKIYYSGDIDPEGILIAENLRKQYSSIELFGYTEDIYLKYLSGKNIPVQSLKKLENINNSELTELVKTIKMKKEAVYQEAFIDEIINFITN